MNFSIETLWDEVKFKPNKSQEQAIKHIDGALYLTAGPGSGKTRVLLWRTLNLIVFHEIKPDENKQAVVDTLKKAVINGANKDYQKQHIDNIKNTTGKHRILD